MRLRYKSISHLKATGDCGDSSFYGFCDDFAAQKCRRQLEIEEGLKGRERELGLVNSDTEEWEDAPKQYVRLREDSERRIRLSVGLGKLGERLSVRGDGRPIMQKSQDRRQDNVSKNPQQF